MIVSIKQWFGIIVLGWYENEDLRPPYENEDPLRKRRSPTKTKTHYENEDPYENEDSLRKRRHITKTSSKEVGITFVDNDYVYQTHYENEDPYGNLEFWIWHVRNLLWSLQWDYFKAETRFKRRDMTCIWGCVAWRFKRWR